MPEKTQKFTREYFDQGLERRGTNCVKWDGMMAQYGDPEMIPMWVADMDFRSAPAIQQALGRVAENGTWGYTLVTDEDMLALCRYWQRRHGVQFEKEDVLMAPCVVSEMRIAVQALTQPGDGVLVNPPVYGPFFASVKESGRTIVESPLLLDDHGRYTVDYDDMEEKLSSGAVKAVLFCSPHNPCGRCWTIEEISRVIEICRKHNVPLICDEIHADFVYAPGKHVSVMRLAQAEDRIVMLCAASKTFNVAGLQQSAMVCRNPEMRRMLQEQRDHAGVTFGNPFALAATRAAYTDCDDWLDGLIDYLKENRDLVEAHAKEKWPQLTVTPLEATYLMWIDMRTLRVSQKELLQAFLDAHVYVNDGLFFGKQGEGFIRLNIACPRSQLEAALTNMDHAIEQLTKVSLNK